MLGKRQRRLRDDLRRLLAEKTSRRLQCPCCGQGAPVHRRALRWAELYGHRCEHGEPCPGFDIPPIKSRRCDACLAATAKTG